MLRKLGLSQKVVVVMLPLILVAVASSLYVSYKNQEALALNLLRSSAETQADIIKESLVHMMISSQRIEEDYLSRINTTGNIKNLSVWFLLDSLHLDEDLLTPARVQRLKERELRMTHENRFVRDEVMAKGQAVWLVQCDIGKHTGHLAEVLSSRSSLWFHECERLKVILPFTADRRCQECHNVPTGKVLGAAYMEIPLAGTTAAFEANTKRSVLIFLVFTGIALAIGAFIFKKFISNPVNRLVAATNVIGSGNLEDRVGNQFDQDEFGTLAKSFDQMQNRLKHAQDELIHRERLSAVGSMASSIIHDFRSPMNVILLAIDMMQHDHPTEKDKRKDLTKSIRISLERMQRMTREILDYSRGEIVLNPISVELGSFLDQLTGQVKTYLAKKNVQLIVDITYHGNMTVDPDRLQRALINIINNAEDAMPDGGRITLRAGVEGNSLKMTITDTGGGIPEEIRDSIFDPFVTAGKSKGTGLGLAITRGIIEQHGGSITFESEEEKGTTFFISLPLAGRPSVTPSSTKQFSKAGT